MPKLIVRRAPTSPIDLPVQPLLRRIYATRNIRSATELDKELRGLAPPAALRNIDQAVDLLHGALRDRWRILIVADFDADGATSCALAVRVLRAFGAAWARVRRGLGRLSGSQPLRAQLRPHPGDRDPGRSGSAGPDRHRR